MNDNDFLGVIKTFLAINLKKLLEMQFIGVGPFFSSNDSTITSTKDFRPAAQRSELDNHIMDRESV